MTSEPLGSGSDAVLIGRFLEMMAAESGAARNTLMAYASDLRLASDALPGGIAAASRNDLTRLADGWADLARATVARKAAALRRFYAFLIDDGLRGDDPSDALPRPGTARRLPKTLSVADVDRLFAAIAERLASATGAPADYRLSALIELLYGSGLRATELMSLPRNAIGIRSGNGGWLREVHLCYGKDFMPKACEPRALGPRDTVPLKIWRGL